VAVVFDYTGRIALLTEAEIPDETFTEWRDTLIGEMSRIGSNILAKIPDEATFLNLIADASSDAWEAFVNPTWPKATMIQVKQRVKLARRYDAWDDGIRATFLPDGYFDDRVLTKANKWKLARYPISLVGLQHHPTIRWRAGTKGVKFFVGDQRITRYMDATLDTYTGDPTYVVKDAYGKFFQALTIGKLVYGYVMSKFADEAGLATTRDDVITTLNSEMDEILSGALDTTKANPALSYLHLSYSAGDFYVKAHAEI